MVFGITGAKSFKISHNNQDLYYITQHLFNLVQIRLEVIEGDNQDLNQYDAFFT